MRSEIENLRPPKVAEKREQSILGSKTAILRPPPKAAKEQMQNSNCLCKGKQILGLPKVSEEGGQNLLEDKTTIVNHRRCLCGGKPMTIVCHRKWSDSKGKARDDFVEENRDSLATEGSERAKVRPSWRKNSNFVAPKLAK